MSLPISKYELTNLTNDIAKARVYVYHTKANPNGSFFEEECLDNSKDSFMNKPIVASYKRDDNDEVEDFKGHEYDESPVGVVPETNNYSTETVDSDNWAVVDCLIFKEYCKDAYELIKENDNSKKISMEIEVVSGEMNEDDGLYHIKQFNLLAITILGDEVPPAMGNNATLTLFSKVDSDKFALKFSEIMNKAKDYLEGGDKVGREEIIAKFSTLTKDEKYTAIVENKELSNEDLEKELFSLSMYQVKEFINEEVGKVTYNRTSSWDGSIRECTKYWVEDVVTDDNIVILCDKSDNYNYVGVPYTFSGDKVTLDYEKCKRYVRGDWREFNGESESEPTNPIMDFAEQVKADIEAFSVKETEEYKTIASELETIKASYSTLESEIKDLRQYKLDKETELKETEYSKVFSKYEKLNTLEKFEEIKKNRMSYSLEDLEDKLIVLAVRNNIQIEEKQIFSTESKPKDMPVDPVIEKSPEVSYAEARYGADIVKKFGILNK